MRATTGDAYTDGTGAYVPRTERIERGAAIGGERRVRADACVIGTGAGGAPVAKELAEGGMRALLYVLELSPWLTGSRARLRQLDSAGRARWVVEIEHARRPQLKLVFKLVKGAAQLSYWGDDRLMLTVGYDADANLRRGRELRARAGRP